MELNLPIHTSNSLLSIDTMLSAAEQDGLLVSAESTVPAKLRRGPLQLVSQVLRAPHLQPADRRLSNAPLMQ